MIKGDGKGKRDCFLVISAVFIMVTVMVFPVMSEMEIAARRAGFVDEISSFDLSAGHAGEIIFRVITGAKEQVLALQNGEVDLIGQFIDPELVPQLREDPFIQTNITPRKGYGYIGFNCARAPVNWSVLRKAFSLALDKHAVQEIVLGGYGSPADSPVPPSMGAWSLDNHPDFTSNYYEADNATGNTILDNAGFIDIDSDSWREDPNGNPIDIEVLGGVSGLIIERVTQQAVNAFTDLHVKSHVELIDFNTLLSRVDDGDFSAVFLAKNLNSISPAILDEFQSFSDNNDWNFNHTVFDDLVDIMMNSSVKEEVYSACWEAQIILWDEQPVAIEYCNNLISAYRNTTWEGFVNAAGEGAFDRWSLLKVRLKEENGSGVDYEQYRQGGSFTVSLPQQMESTNLLNSNSVYTLMPLELVYDTLFTFNPITHEITPWLAKEWLLEEVDQSNLTATPRAVTGDRIKTTFYLHDGLTWHDGSNLTAADVAFSYQYINTVNSPHLAPLLRNVTHIETPNVTTVEVFTNTTGFLAFQQVSIPILPEHIWSGVASPLIWDNPSPIGSGPYMWKSRDPGETVILERNDAFIYNPRNMEYPETTTTTLPSTTLPTQESSTSSHGTASTTTAPDPGEVEKLIDSGILLIQGSIIVGVLVSAGFAAGSLLGKKFSRMKRK